MRSHHLLALVIAVVLLLVSGAGTATAGSPQPAGQTAGQLAHSEQQAAATSSSAQSSPTNSNIAVRVLSPGDGGSVKQSNSSSADAAAGNANATEQAATQSQGGGGGSQVAGQAANSSQAAQAAADAVQHDPRNGNISVRVLSPGRDGAVEQDNHAGAQSAAANANETDQDVAQSQGSGGSQASGQDASNAQDASSEAHATQDSPSNSNVSVRTLSPGDDGDVTQTNAVGAHACACNANETSQETAQTAGGGGGGIQASAQQAANDQSADANADAEQHGASNTNAPVRVLSPGDDGDVTQTNGVAAHACACNANETEQSVDQRQGGTSRPAPTTVRGGCRCDNGHADGAGGSQTAGQHSTSEQSARSQADAAQDHPSNTNAPVRVLSPGDGGAVEQTNAVIAGSQAGNANDVDQGVSQSGGGSGGGPAVQAAGQDSASSQRASSDASSHQEGASNANAPVRVGSPGDGGSVSQANASSATACACNANELEQSVEQSHAGGKGYGPAVQASAQRASNEQDAQALARASQEGARNVNAPVRSLSDGDGGRVVQWNGTSASSAAGNLNELDQSVEQALAGIAGIQSAGQEAANRQAANADADARQSWPANLDAPVWTSSAGEDGSLGQGNGSYAGSSGANGHDATQDVGQSQG